MFHRSVPLSVQLLLTFVGLIAGTTAVLTIAAYRSSHSTLEVEARRRVHVAAQNREEMLQRFLISRQRRAAGFIASLDSICGESGAAGRVSWEIGCVYSALEEFRATEQATGAVLMHTGRRIATAGGSAPENEGINGALAEIVTPDGRPDGESEFVMRTALGRASLIVRFPVADLLPYFEDRSDLGNGGEVFLTAADGRFLTPARYNTAPTPPGTNVVEAVHNCVDGPAEHIDIDYRGMLTIHGSRPVDDVIGAGCVDAHIPYSEALAPAEELRAQLIARGAMFMIIGALLSILASQWIAAPVRRLATSARALEAGDFDRTIRISGPSEVRALARAFTASARSIAQLVTREQAARREAESANRAKDDFLATVSHELRTPLTAMLGWARLLRSGRLDAIGARRAAAAIERSAEAQARLVDDLLDISRIVAGRLRLKRNAMSLAVPVEAAVEAVRPLAADKHVTVRTQIDTPAAHVFGDAERLQQVVWNLLTNAVKFTPAGGHVLVRLRSNAGRAELTVADTGAGIAPEFLPHVFERFRQANGAMTRTHSGLGLGLAIVRHLAKLHGGEVTAQSAGEGKGSTFTVTLPLYDGPAPIRSAEPARRATASPSRPLESIPVLLVDDDDETLGVVRAILEDAGAKVRTASSAAGARESLAAGEPAVLISDIGMPSEDGYSLLRSLRAADNALPAIALTAYARREDVEEAHAAGFQVHIAKPVDAHDLIDAVASLAKPVVASGH